MYISIAYNMIFESIHVVYDNQIKDITVYIIFNRELYLFVSVKCCFSLSLPTTVYCPLPSCTVSNIYSYPPYCSIFISVNFYQRVQTFGTYWPRI